MDCDGRGLNVILQCCVLLTAVVLCAQLTCDQLAITKLLVSQSMHIFSIMIRLTANIVLSFYLK